MTLKNQIHQCSIGFLLLFAFSACHRPSGEPEWPPDIRRDLEARYKQLELKLGASKEEWKRNERIVVIAYLTNKGRRGVTLVDGGQWWNYRIAVEDANNQVVPMDMSLAKQLNRGAVSAREQYLKPGETLEEKILLSNDFDLSRAGVYKIMIQRQAAPRGIAEQLPISNTITISVVE